MSDENGARVVVTGMGAVTPVGLNVDDYWEGLVAGRSGIGPISLFDADQLTVRIAGEATGFEPTDYIERKASRRMDRFSQFAVVAAAEAVRSAGDFITEANCERVGTMIGTGIGGITTLNAQFDVLHERGPNRISPFVVPMMLPNMASGQVSIELGARGPNIAPTSACSSAADAIGIAAKLLREGDADWIVAGGAEAPICEMSVAGFAAARALSVRNDAPEEASRPFDRGRDGFVMGEGAGVLILELAKHALERGAPILCELAGYGAVADAYHLTQPIADGDGGARAMQAALTNAALEAEEVDYINAHGTSTPANDGTETKAIKRVFGESAQDIPISSTKSMTGHLMGAAGAIEAIACIKSIREGVIPPTINLTDPDPECDLNYTALEAATRDVRVALTNSMGFGGHNACLVFKRWEP
ncbi:MAG: beta-ketoacyl-ACP synthase II [Chloroflexi bacterium]|nr:beta-ketoacyl-ACP synthase II [Chloroflexota bacterium]